jgi:hypothetical protein
VRRFGSFRLVFSEVFLGAYLSALLSAFSLSSCAETEFTSNTDGGRKDGIIRYDQTPIGPIRPQCAGQEATISGTVYAPNGVDPVPGATVFVPSSVPELFPPEVKCEVCGSLGTAENFWTTTSAADGTFTLENVCPGDNVPLVLQNGRFRRFLRIKIPEKGIVRLNATQSRLPRKTGELDPIDAVPRIAVVTGDYDKMECVLRKMGLDELDLFEGGKELLSPKAIPKFIDLVGNVDRMKIYNIIFINCTDDTWEKLLQQQQIRDNINDYVKSGGRLYVTDWSYDWIEQVSSMSGFIDFEPGQSSDQPEKANTATLGQDGIEVDAIIKDKNLAAWLKNFSNTITEPGGVPTVHVEHFLGGWVMMHDLHKDTKLWVEGKVRGDGINGVRPLTVTFNFKNCGKVLFSSYHTEGRENESTFFPKPFPNYCGTKNSPQDRILEYLIFDIANCIKPIQ